MGPRTRRPHILTFAAHDKRTAEFAVKQAQLLVDFEVVGGWEEGHVYPKDKELTIL